MNRDEHASNCRCEKCRSAARKPCPEMAIAEREALALERIATALEQLVETATDIVGAIHGAAETFETESRSARGIERHD